MKALLFELNRILDKQVALYEAFILVLEEQWQSVTTHSLESLEEVQSKKESLLDKIQKLEKVRLELMGRIEKQVRIKGLTLKKVIQFKVNPYRAQLSLNREKLLDHIRIVNELHSRIKILLNHSSLSLKKSLAFIHATAEKAAAPYCPDGKVAKSKATSRMLSMDA